MIQLTENYIRKNLEVKTTYIGNYDKEYKYRKNCLLKSPIGKISYIPMFCNIDYDFEHMVGYVIRQENNCEPLIYD